MPSMTAAVRRALLSAALVALAAPVAASTPAVASDSGAGRAGTKLAALAARADRRAEREPTSVTPHQAGPRGAPRTAAGSTRGATSVGASPSYCDSISARLNLLADRTVLSYVVPTGASRMTITRTRTEGATQTVDSRAVTGIGTTVSVVDRRTSRAAYPAYVLQTTTPVGTTSCTFYPPLARDLDLVAAADDGSALVSNVDGRPTGLGDPSLFTDTVATSPDGRWVATAAATSTGSFDIRLMRTDGLGSPVLVAGTALDEVEPAFSPDGRYLAYTRIADDGSTSLGLYNLHTHGTTSVPGSSGLVTPTWARDSIRIVAASGTNELANLVYVNATSGARTSLANTPHSLFPAVAPNGTVAYGYDDGTSSQIRLWNPANGTTRVRGTVPSATTSLDRPRFDRKGTTLYALQGSVRTDPQSGQPAVTNAVVVSGDASASAALDTLWGGWFDQPYVADYDLRQLAPSNSIDLDRDLADDVVLRDPAGRLRVYSGSAAQGHVVSAGWNIYTALVTPGDLNADGVGDLIARDATGALWFIGGNGSGGVDTRRRVGSGWNGYTIIGAGDFDGDTRADLLARDGSGHLWLYPGTGSGGQDVGAFGARRLVGSGWAGYTVVGVGDASFDGTTDLFARRPDGTGWLYPGNGAGGFGRLVGYGGGWTTYDTVARGSSGIFPAVVGRRNAGPLAGWVHSYTFFGDGALSYARGGELTLTVDGVATNDFRGYTFPS